MERVVNAFPHVLQRTSVKTVSGCVPLNSSSFENQLRLGPEVTAQKTATQVYGAIWIETKKSASGFPGYQPAGAATYTATPRPGSLSTVRSPYGRTVRPSSNTCNTRPARPGTVNEAVAGAVEVFTAIT